jgi:hypothetical protein
VAHLTQGVGKDKDLYVNMNGNKALSHKITDLMAFTKYSCTVQARTTVGLGKRSKKAVFVTATTGLLTLLCSCVALLVVV